MKNKNNKKKRKLLLALLFVLVTGGVLSASTYAWFTANKVVTVNDIDVNVASSNGIQVSVDGVNWKSIISNDDILNANKTYSDAVNQLPSDSTNLSPVSTIGEIDSKTGFMNMFTGDIDSDEDGNYILVSEQSVEKDGDAGNFIAFDLFLQVTKDTPVYLTSKSGVALTSDIVGIDNATRVAFVNEGNTEAGSKVEDIQGMLADDDSEVIIWELNYDKHTAAGVSNALSTYGLTTKESGADQLAYYGVKADIAKEKGIVLDSTDSNYFAAVTPTISTKAAGIPTTAYEEAFNLKAGVTKIRVYMWIEGQDVDCENNASGGSVKFSLQFSTNSSITG